MRVGIAIVQHGDKKLLEALEVSLEPMNGEIFSYDIYDTAVAGNIGFTKANNRLIRSYLHDPDDLGQPDWVWLLNNDTTVPKPTFTAIETKLLDYEPSVIGFKILVADQSDFIHHAGTTQAFPNGIHKSGSVKLKQFTKQTREKWVTFASVLIHRKIFEEIGVLDERMQHICSDSDFCYRARAAGFPVFYEPSFEILHKIGTSQKPTPKIGKMMIYDTHYFQNKWMNGKLFMDLDRELLQ